jgi:hypothetical protein
MSAQETRGIDDPDPGRDAKQLRRVGNARHADVDGQLDLAAAHAAHPLLHDPRVEAEVAHDVGRDPPFVPHRLDRHVVVDEAVTLRIAGDADVVEVVFSAHHRLEERYRVGKFARRLARVAGDHKNAAHSHLLDRFEDLVKV